MTSYNDCEYCNIETVPYKGMNFIRFCTKCRTIIYFGWYNIITEYQIIDKEGVTIGRFSERKERDSTFNDFVKYGFKKEENLC